MKYSDEIRWKKFEVYLRSEELFGVRREEKRSEEKILAFCF
jgi:hypothetical protein